MKTTLDNHGFAISDGSVQVYNVDPKNGEFISESEEFLNQGVGLPAYSYLDKPLPAKQGFVVCRQGDDWVYQEDHRETLVYSTETGERVTITEPGALPDNLTSSQPQTPFDKWNGSAWVMDIDAKQKAETDKVTADKQRLELQAKEMIVTLSDAIELELALPDDDLKLLAWRKYRVLLNQLDTKNAQDIKWPALPDC
ncbi:tail fiber assembly protein [Pragia fontium]|uniref:tail fiber assembly protein n=1 Tax=Pragia fontium TaxID=82985 RepID=UPI00069C11BC|nr:tail assembly chaperone [Pragia fontium]